jgi:hypothetical protein
MSRKIAQAMRPAQLTKLNKSFKKEVTIKAELTAGWLCEL